ncbi:MAG: hypothetical protein KGL57_01275 [Burkholderiales bacterium]|nr:hypothetical protein [Burkholderiales bacterium]
MSVTVSGTVFAGRTFSATVEAYAIDASGQPAGSPIGTGTTAADGSYSLTLTSAVNGPVLLVSRGGHYASEADGSEQAGVSLKVLIPALSSGKNVAQLNPLTSSIAAHAQDLIGNSATSAADAVAAATTTVKTVLGVTSMVGDPLTVAPDTGATSGDAWVLSALAGTIEQLRASTKLDAAALYQAFLDDIADGKLDGVKRGKPIMVGDTASLQSSLFTTQLSGAANTYGAANAQYKAATAGISASLQVSAQAVGVAIGSSGSIAPLQTQADGTQIYFAARRDGLLQLNMKDPANPAAAKMAVINAAVLTSAGGKFFDSIDGIVINPTPITVSGAAKVFGILYSYGSKKVVSVNLTDGVVNGAVDLPVTLSSSFSGASAYVSGGMADGQRNMVWLATAHGLMGVDPSDLSKPVVTIAQPAGTSINENIGGDPAHDIVFTPDYDSKGIVVFNLAERKSYVMDKTSWQALLNGQKATSFVSNDLDGAALDSQYHAAVITAEYAPSVVVMGYSTPTGASGDTGTFASSKLVNFAVPGGKIFAGSALDPVTHTALFVGEGSNLGVGVLDDPAGADWKGFSSFVSAGVSSYGFGPHDPHTVGTFNIGGKPYGFLLQGYSVPYKVVVLDLAAMLAAPNVNGVLKADPFKDAGIAHMLTY